MKEARELEGDERSWTACLKFFDYLTGGDVEALRSSDAVVQLQRKLLPTAVTGGKLLADQDYATDVRILNDYYAMLLTMAAKPDAQPVFERGGTGPNRDVQAPTGCAPDETRRWASWLAPQSDAQIGIARAGRPMPGGPAKMATRAR